MSSGRTLFVEDFPVRTSVRPDWLRAFRERALNYGKSKPVLFLKLDRNTSSWRMLQHSLTGGLVSFSGTWPRSGMMHNGIVYRLPTLAPSIRGTDCGWWPTPQRLDRYFCHSTPQGLQSRIGKKQIMVPHIWQLGTGRRYAPPELSEWLMGFQETWSFVLDLSGMPYNLRSRKSSVGPSSRTPGMPKQSREEFEDEKGE